jgi:DNA-binding MarR family transcriptional regulator
MSAARRGTGHDDNVVGALALALVDRIGDATGDAAGVTGIPAAALAALHEWAGERPIQTLADGLRLSHSRTVRVIDRLQAEGLARRARDPDDGRSALVALTPRGAEAARRVLDARAAVLDAALGQLAPADRAALARLAEQVLEALIAGRREAGQACRLCDAHACGHHEGRCPVTRGADAAVAAAV